MKTLSTLMILLAAATMNAQTLWPYSPSKRIIIPEIRNGQNKDLVAEDFESRAGITLYSEDFESGLNGWIIDAPSGNVEWTLTNTGNTAGFSPGPLESSTGFPIGSWVTADSDAQGTAGIQEVTTITSPPITNLNSYTSLILEFEQSFRQLNDDESTVEISPDGGANWTVYSINTEIVGNQSTPDAPVSQLISLNITDALNGGANDIRIRFRWVSFEGFTYAWNVDDVKLVEAPGNDLVVESVTYSEWFYDQAVDFSTLEYSVYPVNLLRPFEFKANVSNNGTNAQTGVNLIVNVDGPNNNDFNAMSTSVDLLSGESDSILVDGYTPPGIIGNYDILFEVAQDQTDEVPSNNVAEKSFAVSQHVYARDLGSLDGVYDNQGDAYEIGNWFHVNNWGSTLHGIDVALSDQSDPGALIVAVLYDGDRDYITESEEYLIQASDLNGTGGDIFITLPLIDAIELDQDEDYLVVIKHFGGNDNVVVGTSGVSIPQTSLIYDVLVSTWFFVTSTPMVRMNLDPTVGIFETSNSMGSEMMIFPNPMNNIARIQFKLNESVDLQFEMIDAMGRSVQQQDLGKMGKGSHQIEVRSENLSPGIYTAVLRTDKAIRTLPVIIE